jgi:putative DNA primase/helicase
MSDTMRDETLTDYEVGVARRRLIETWETAAELQKRFADAVKPYVSINDRHLVKDWTIWRWDLDPRWNTHRVIVVDVAEGASVDRVKEILDQFKLLWTEDLGIDRFEHGEPYRMGEKKPRPEETGEVHLTDMGNATRLVHWHGDSLLYCHPWKKWLVWDGQRWKSDVTAAVTRMAKDTVRRIYSEASSHSKKRDREDTAKWAMRSEAKERIKSMIELARSEVPVLPEQLDADPWMLTVANGVLDLRTGELLRHDPNRLSTKLVEVEYDRAADCPLWLKFLDEIMDGDETMIRFLQRAVGYSLTGDASERCVFILYGCGANGKTTFLEVARALLGDYALRTPTETLMVKRSGSIPNDVARLKGARFVSASESEAGRRLAESLIKDITGGDTISARFLWGEWFDFVPECKVWLATNHKPEIRGTDKAIWDRVRLIPFEVVIPEAEQDKQLADKLTRELAGILAWAVEGCIAWQRDGLGVADKVRQATAAYRGEQDVLGEFIEDCCVEGDVEALASDLYDAYREWGGELSQRKFGLTLRERGYTKERRTKDPHKGRIQWLGIGLVNFSEEVNLSEPDSNKIKPVQSCIPNNKGEGSLGSLDSPDDPLIKAGEVLGGKVSNAIPLEDGTTIPF